MASPLNAEGQADLRGSAAVDLPRLPRRWPSRSADLWARRPKRRRLARLFRPPEGPVLALV